MWTNRFTESKNRRLETVRRNAPRRQRRLHLEALEARKLLASDFLYIGDSANDSVQKFDAETGAYVGNFVTSGSAGLHGPRGFVFDQGRLLLVNQNVDLPKNGEVLRYDGQTGAAAGSLVPATSTNAATLDYEDPPILSGIESSPRLIEGRLTNGDGIVYVSNTIEVTDLDGMVNGATVRITGNFHSDQDRLSAGATPGGNIVANWNASTGTLTLQGRDTIDNYRIALRTISYTNASRTPNLAKRTVSFTVHDSPTDSNTVSRDMILAKDDLNALFYSARFQAAARTNDILIRLDIVTGQVSGPFVIPGHEEGGLLIVAGTTLLAAGRNLAAGGGNGEEGSFFSGSAARATLLRFPDRTTLVADTSVDAPVDPEAMVLDGNTLYIADTRASQPANGSIPSGRIRRYNATSGVLLNDITASGYNGLFHPRGLVFGPDGSLYVSLYDPNTDAAGRQVNPGYGAILKINTASPAPVVVAFNNGDAAQDAGETPDLHDPGSLAFGPDGKLYVTTRGRSADDLDKIIVLNPAAAFTQAGYIDIARVDAAPLHARAMLFGPAGKLFVSVNEPDVADPFTFSQGYLRSYDTATKQYTVAATAEAGPIGYFTFGYTNPKTLSFEPPAGAAPILSGVELTAADSPTNVATTATSTLVVSDGDSQQLTGAFVAITEGYNHNQDTLTFTDTAKINGFWDQSTGRLRLVGADTIANYQAALRNVKFQNNSPVQITPVLGRRTIQFQVSDGDHSSNAVLRDLSVSVLRGDFLFIGDQGDPADPSDDTVEQFDINNGGFIGTFVKPGQLIGPRGVLFHAGELLAVNQNVDQPLNGEVVRFDGKSGAALNPPVVSSNNAQAPFAPRGMVVKDNVLYVADFLGGSTPRIAKYNATTGAFIGDLVPGGFNAPFNPRGLVFGPDDKLYVTVYSADENVVFSQDPSGYVLKFLDTTTGAFEVVASNNGDGVHTVDEVADLHNPEGIVFGPDGRLYVTSFRFGARDNSIVILNAATKQRIGSISLGDNYSQALLFGPDGALFVPINGGGDAGSVRKYDVATGTFNTFIVPSGGVLQTPWYLTFKQTDPATLAYKPWHNFAKPLDMDDSGLIVPLDALLIIAELNSPTVTDPLRRLPSSRGASNFYYDVNDDGFVAPLDVLIIINFLNAALPHAEGESGPVDSAPPQAPSSLGDLSSGSARRLDAAIEEYLGSCDTTESAVQRGPHGTVFEPNGGPHGRHQEIPRATAVTRRATSSVLESLQVDSEVSHGTIETLLSSWIKAKPTILAAADRAVFGSGAEVGHQPARGG